MQLDMKMLAKTPSKIDLLDEELSTNRGIGELSPMPGFASIADWKGKHYMQWLLYHGLPFLCEYAPREYSKNFKYLNNAIFLLSKTQYQQNNVDLGNEYILTFLDTYKELYGVENVGSNVHDLLHLSKSVELSGQLYVNSTFHFERLNFLIR